MDSLLLEHSEVIMQSLEQLLGVVMFRVHLQCTKRGGEKWELQVKVRGSLLDQVMALNPTSSVACCTFALALTGVRCWCNDKLVFPFSSRKQLRAVLLREMQYRRFQRVVRLVAI